MFSSEVWEVSRPTVTNLVTENRKKIDENLR